MPDRTAVACSHCGHMYALPREFLGKTATCKSCGQKFVAVETSVPHLTAVPEGPPTPATQTATTKPPMPATPAPPRPAPAVMLPSKREVPIAAPPRTPAGPAVSRTALLGESLDDSVLAWLDEEGAEAPPPPPRVVTTADICNPGQRKPLRGPHAAPAPPPPAAAQKAPAKH